MRWISDGDKNTIFYHVTVVQRRIRKNISLIKSNDVERIEDPKKIQKLFKDWYHKLFTVDVEMKDRCQINIKFPSIESHMLNFINEGLKDDEIKQAMFDMAPWKSTDLNGFPIGLYQKNWNLVEAKVCTYIKEL